MRVVPLALLLSITGCGISERDSTEPPPRESYPLIQPCPADTVQWPTTNRCAKRAGFSPAVGPTVLKPRWDRHPFENFTQLLIAPDGELVTASDTQVDKWAAKDGTTLWTVYLPFNPTISLDENGTIYVASQGPPKLVALDATGAQLWERRFPEQYWYVDGFLVTDAGLLLRMSSDHPENGERSAIWLLDPNGEPRWITELSGAGSQLSADESHVYVGTTPGLASALTLTSGEVAWQVQVPGMTEEYDYPRIVVGDGTLVATGHSNRAGLDLGGGEVWTASGGIQGENPGASLDQYGFVRGAITNHDPKTGAVFLDRAAYGPDGRLAWRFESTASWYSSNPSPIVDGRGTTYFAYSDALLEVVDARGVVLAKEALDEVSPTSLALSDEGVLYVGGDGLIAYEP
jgi:outer membrane protein assembly factor BamB